MLSSESLKINQQAIGNRIKTARNDAKLTQSELAIEAGTTPQSWGKYEDGTVSPRIDVLLPLTKRGYSLDWIFTGEGEVQVAQKSSKRSENIQTQVDIDTEIQILEGELANLATVEFPEELKDKYPSELTDEQIEVFGNFMRSPRNSLSFKLQELKMQKKMQQIGENVARTLSATMQQLAERFVTTLHTDAAGKHNQPDNRQRPLRPTTTNDQPSLSEMLIMTSTVLESKTVYRPALSSNIQAFYQAVKGASGDFVKEDDQHSDSELLLMTSKILESGTIYRSALVSNILAFYQAVQGEEEMGKIREDVAAQRLEIKALTDMLATMQKKLDLALGVAVPEKKDQTANS